jgi:ADP-ribose pyrophosphatase
MNSQDFANQIAPDSGLFETLDLLHILVVCTMKYRIEVLDSETCCDGFFLLKRYRLRHSLFAGGWSEEIVRERVERLRAASVLLYDPVADAVVMIEQFRIGALEQGEGAWLLETVGGLVEPGQDPDDVARREAWEEAGCEILDLLPICEFFVSPGTSVERIHLFCGRVDSRNAEGIHGLAHEGEDIRVEVLGAEQAIAELYTGRINSTSAIISTQWLAMHRMRLRREPWIPA